MSENQAARETEWRMRKAQEALREALEENAVLRKGAEAHAELQRRLAEMYVGRDYDWVHTRITENEKLRNVIDALREAFDTP